MKKILILTAGFGDGHNSAAFNLRDALESLLDEVRVEVLDLLESSYGRVYFLVRKTHFKLVQYAPRVWSSIYSFIDSSTILDRNSKLQERLGQVLNETHPDCVVSTYPLYGHVINQLFHDHQERPFRFITVITDSISANAAWFRVPSDFYCVANEATAEVLEKAGVNKSRIRPLGFPVNPIFALEQVPVPPYPNEAEPKRILYIINSGQKKAGKHISQLLEQPEIRLTACGLPN